MARGVNKVILVGICGQDPETRYMPNGNAATNLSLATSEQWTDKQTGQKAEKTEWHRVSLFGKVAEIAGEYLRKGSQSTSRASCRLGSGRRTVSSVTPRKSSWICKARCSCWAVDRKATRHSGRLRVAIRTRRLDHSHSASHDQLRSQYRSRVLRIFQTMTSRLWIPTALAPCWSS